MRLQPTPTTTTTTTTTTGRTRQRWPLWGLPAGILGFVGHALTQAPVEIYEQTSSGARVIDLLDRGPYHVGVVAGIGAIGCLLLLSAGWRRWAHLTGTTSLAATAVPGALVASAGAMILAYGVKGSMAIYLPGGLNAGEYPREGLYVLWMIDDLSAFTAWWGVALAALLITWTALHDRALPRSVGLTAILGWLPPVGFLLATGLPGFPGIAGPIWLVATSILLALIRLDGAPTSDNDRVRT